MTEPSANKRSELLFGGLLLLVASGWSAWHWLQLGTLLEGDNLRWMDEALRASRGELIYRDFASMYPPLGIWLTSLLYRTFGATFAVTNAMIDGLSLLLVLVIWRLARRLVDERVAFGCALVLACMGATNSGNFGLFSLALYTPAALCGAIGLGLFLSGALELLADGSSLHAKAFVAVGLNLALLSKLEHGVAGIAAFPVLALSTLPVPLGRDQARRWAFSWASVALGAVAPSVVVYALLARAVGSANLLAGVLGYGVVAQYCPFWPTGLGVLGGLSALGQGAAIMAALAIVYGRKAWPGTPSKFVWCLAVAVGGTLLWALHLPYALENFRVSQPTLKGLPLLVSYLGSYSGLLLPFMWAVFVLAISCGARFSARLWRATPDSTVGASVLVLLVVTASLGSRGAFGHVFGNTTIVHQSAYPFLLLLMPYLLLNAQALIDELVQGRHSWKRASELRWIEFRRSPSVRAWLVLISVAAVFTLPRLARSLWRPAAPRLETRAGRAYIADSASLSAYAYVTANTRPEDRILEIPNGGGLAFAAGLRSATVSTEFIHLVPPERLMRLDADLVRTQPPRLVLGLDIPWLGAHYGTCCPCACTFPHLVWRSHKLACDPNHHFEALDYVLSHYAAAAHFGAFVALAPALAGGVRSLPRGRSNCNSCSAPEH